MKARIHWGFKDETVKEIVKDEIVKALSYSGYAAFRTCMAKTMREN